MTGQNFSRNFSLIYCIGISFFMYRNWDILLNLRFFFLCWLISGIKYVVELLYTDEKGIYKEGGDRMKLRFQLIKINLASNGLTKSSELLLWMSSKCI